MVLWKKLAHCGIIAKLSSYMSKYWSNVSYDWQNRNYFLGKPPKIESFEPFVVAPEGAQKMFTFSELRESNILPLNFRGRVWRGWVKTPLPSASYTYPDFFGQLFVPVIRLTCIKKNSCAYAKKPDLNMAGAGEKLNFCTFYFSIHNALICALNFTAQQ